MKGAARRTTHGATATVNCATAKSSLDTPATAFVDNPVSVYVYLAFLDYDM